jgi:hypothetical protein
MALRLTRDPLDVVGICSSCWRDPSILLSFVRADRVNGKRVVNSITSPSRGIGLERGEVAEA